MDDKFLCRNRLPIESLLVAHQSDGHGNSIMNTPASIAADEALRPHRRRLLNIAVRAVRDKDVAEDLVQETLIRAYVAWPRRNHDAQIKNWIDRILINRILDYMSGEKRRSMEQSLTDMLQNSLCNNSDLIHLEERLEIDYLMSQLTTDDAGLLLLHGTYGLAMSEIAYMTGRTVEHVTNRYRQAKEKARKLLAR